MYEITVTSLNSQFSIHKSFSRTLTGALGLAAFWLESNDYEVSIKFIKF